MDAKRVESPKVHGRLDETVELDRLQEILDKFARATSIAAIVADVDGVPITKPSNFTRHCQMVRASIVGAQGCWDSDRRVGQQAVQQGAPALHRCHCGLIDMAAPIVVDGVYWGSVLCGQVLLEPPNEACLQQVRSRALVFGLDPDELAVAFQEIETVSEEKIWAAGELLQIVANYIVEMSVARLRDKRLAQELKERAEMEGVMRRLELSALQAQVNPHFLFNTLNTASRLALIEGAPRTEELVHALASLLRYTLRNIEQIVPLREELEHIRNYLFIQKTRYGDHFGVEISVDPDVLDTPIPVMTLQPLVENAIVHGLEPKEDGGSILIAATRAEGIICVEVKDTGVGIDPELAGRVLEEGGSGMGHTTGLGLSNVHRRLQHCFGPEYGLEIYGQPAKGTTVVVRIPGSVQKSWVESGYRGEGQKH